MSADHPGRRPVIIVTCEHASARIPAAYRALFRDAGALLASHRGWDPGALAVARRLARTLDAPLLATTTSRLLVDHNRSPGSPALWSERTRVLPAAPRERLLARHYWPHRHAVAAAVATAVDAGRSVLHLAVHSFTPVLAGHVRRADVGLLYDPGRAGEAALARRWRAGLADAGLHARLNYPYRGVADGLTTWLRRRHGARAYRGLEIELNQRLLARGGAPAALSALLATTLARLLEDGPQSSGQDRKAAPTAASQKAGSRRAGRSTV